MKKLFLILIIALAGAVGGAAQEAVVKSFEAAPMDVTAQQYARLDLHGEKCALVKVRVVARDVTFSGSVMGEVQKRGSEYWVYMPAGTKMLQVTAETFLPFLYTFPEPLRGGVTYVLTVQAPQPAAGVPQKPAENFLVLKVSPANAHVYVDDTERRVEDGVVSVPLADGVHTYRAEAVGYAPVSESVTMAGERVARTVTLRSTMPVLSVSAATPGTEIFVNDMRRGATSWRGELAPGDYIVEGRLTGHRSHTQKVTLAEGQNSTVAIPALEAITGSLSVTYKPVDATITIDGRAAGVTPNVINNLPVGTHTVVIAKDGFSPATHTVTVAESATATLSGELSPAPADASNAMTDYFFGDNADVSSKYERFQDAAGKFGYKHDGRMVISARFDDAGVFREGLAAVKVGGKYGFIDPSGELVIPALYDYAFYFREGMAMVKSVGLYGYIDKTGKLVVPPQYDYAGYFSEGLAYVATKGKVGCIDKTGKMVIPQKYRGIGEFHEGLAAVWHKGKWGFIDTSGKIVIPAKYDDARTFINGRVSVQLDGRWFTIDRNGKEVK
ncbi:MAG: WG repeat-containing protein [Bacteroidales bacterium]|nr:WG repeat-containing protein [Bacteroidales bacterium]MDY2916372.1 WG repeat-containing protein [Muribaculaceae bacterium]